MRVSGLDVRMMFNRVRLGPALLALVPLSLFWVILILRIPSIVSKPLANYSAALLLLVLAAYYASFRLPGRYAMLAGLAVTMFVFAMALSYRWTSAYSDTGLIGGLLPYKDAKDYYTGAVRLLSGLPLDQGIRAMRRPLSSGLLTSLLLLTGQDLKITVALLVQLTGFGLYLAARQIHKAFGAWAAAVFGSLMFLYIQPMIGYTMSEMPGFMLGCWAFSILWLSSHRRGWTGISLGLITLMAAVSARAGAFLIFPCLALWAGWIFREGQRFSWRAAGIVAGITLLSYLLMNMVLPNLLGVPPDSGFGSFVYAMYGQVHGGTGWHSGIEALHTNGTRVIAAATIQYFLAHPLDLVIASVKSYRDLFLPGPLTIFAFGSDGEPVWLTYLLWAATMGLIVWGLIHLVQNLRSPIPGLMVAAAAGIVLSVPFLPPIDAGSRFYASTMAFFFALPAFALGRLPAWITDNIAPQQDSDNELRFTSYSALTLLVVTAIAPVLVYLLSPRLSPSAPVCPAAQHAFVIKTAPESYIDVTPGGTRECGGIPGVCLGDFIENGTEKAIDDFFQDLLALAQSSQSGMRVTPAINLLDAKFHYFVDLEPHRSAVPATRIVSGCAVGMPTKNQSIYLIMSSAVAAEK
jgi:hypothetical protein